MEHCTTREEVRLEAQLAEERMDKKLTEYATGQAKVISNLFSDVKDKLSSLDDKMDTSILDRNSIHAMLERILEQTTRTNGRVTNLENKVSSLEGDKRFLYGGLAVLTTLFVPILFMVIHEWISG